MLIPFEHPSPLNESDVLINNVHFNSTALGLYNYSLYSNGTLSNSSECFLAFGPYHPTMVFPPPANVTHQHHHHHNGSDTNITTAAGYYYDWPGTMANATSCFSPVKPMGQHASIDMVFALLFAVSILWSLSNLHKHGCRYHPSGSVTRRFASSTVGRRAMWFWLVFLAVCATVSCFMGVDVDRDYLQSVPLMLQGLFYTLLTPILMAAVWEGVRHWQVLFFSISIFISIFIS